MEIAAMRQLFLGFILTIGFAASAHAQLTSSVGVTYLSDHRGVDVGALVGSIGYRLEGDSGWSFQPELRAGTGIIDDSLPGYSPVGSGPMIDIDIDSLIAAVARVQYQTNGSAYFFGQANVTEVSLDAGKNLATRPLNESDWEVGLDVGIGTMLGERFAIEGSYGILNGDPVANAGLRVYF